MRSDGPLTISPSYSSNSAQGFALPFDDLLRMSPCTLTLFSVIMDREAPDPINAVLEPIGNQMSSNTWKWAGRGIVYSLQKKFVAGLTSGVVKG